MAVVAHFGVRERSTKFFAHWISRVVGILVLGYALWNANDNAKIIGVIWLLLGAGIASYWHIKGRRPALAEV